MMMAFSFMDMKTSLQKNTIRVHWVHFGLACSNNGSCLALHYTVIFLENVFPAKKKYKKNFVLNQKSFMERKDKSVKHFLFFDCSQFFFLLWKCSDNVNISTTRVKSRKVYYRPKSPITASKPHRPTPLYFLFSRSLHFPDFWVALLLTYNSCVETLCK